MSNKKLLQAAAGTAAAGGGSLYVEDVFSTHLYTGTGSAQTITNGIDLDGEGGLVWIKNRDTADDNVMFSPTFGPSKMQRIKTDAQETVGTDVFQSFNSDGFTHGGWGGVGGNGNDIASWTFRKAEKFFDVVTYTSNGQSGQTISHSLGSVPGMILVKRTDGTSDWISYNSTGSAYKQMVLNTNAANNSDKNFDQIATDSTLKVGHIGGTTGVGGLNGQTCVAYLFASDAGGFGEDGSENIIKCGSYTTDGAGGATVDVGFEPQWILSKRLTGTQNWVLTDVMRGSSHTSTEALKPDTSAAEQDFGLYGVIPTATGFINNNSMGAGDFIYIAIRRPMKTPTEGTEVFSPQTRSGSGAIVTTGVGFTPDVFYNFDRTYGGSNGLFDRLRGRGILQTMSTAAENATSPAIYDLVGFDTMDGVELGGAYNINMTGSGRNFADFYFKRATGFMDVVVANASNPAVANPHNLGVVPELIIIRRTVYSGNDWSVSTNHTSTTMTSKYLNSTSVSGQGLNTAYTANYNLLGAQPTATNFTMRNQSDGPFACYLFATLAGVSKVGSYTGTGANLNVDCGFSAGARFVLITRVDSAGNWFVYDSARGIVAGADPYVLANSSAAEDSTNDDIDPLSSGFSIPSGSNVNASGGTYIFLAIA